jgi:ATP-dependent exoDNAse (exonuclease V) alpha subunit
VASYHLSVKTVSRATGRSGPGAAAYRTASLIQCERDGTTHDYTRRSGVEASFIVAPPGAVWAQDRAALWNAVEAAEKRKDAKVAREYELALPHELAPKDRRTLAEGFAREVVTRFGVVADVAIHAPHRHGDERNWHVHVLTTTRVAGAEGLGAKTRELDVVQTSGPAVEALRQLWAVQVNHALERIQSEARVDHRSYARQGEDQVATQHMGPAAAAMERKAARRSAERAQEGARMPPEPRQETTRALPAPVEAPRPVQVQEAAQDGPGPVQEAPRPVLQPVAGESSPDAPRAAVRPSAGVSGAGLEPATRIGQRNAEIGERNRAVQAARAALDVARRALEGLERAAAAGQRWVSGLARGLGAQIAGEREERARQAERQREALARDAAARLAEQERQQQARIAAEQAKPAITQEQRDAARQAGTWGRVEDIGRQAREADRARQGPDHERPGERQGPRM